MMSYNRQCRCVPFLYVTIRSESDLLSFHTHVLLAGLLSASVTSHTSVGRVQMLKMRNIR